MQYCPSCGEENNPEANHCQYCGVPLKAPSPDIVQSRYQQADVLPEEKGVVTSLFDFSFHSLITFRVIRFIYGLILILSCLIFVGFGLSEIGIVVEAVGNNVFKAFMIYVGCFILFLLYLIYLRVWFEMNIIFLRMAEDLRTIRDLKRK